MRNILITGCSSGIGLETALFLKENNVKVYASAREQKDVIMLEKLGLIAFKIDVRNKDEIKFALNEILKQDNKLDSVFNNAGFAVPGAIEDIDTEVLKELFDTNFFGLHEVTIQAMKIFREQGYGKIIQHSSVLGIISLRFRGAYNASKYAIEGLCDTLRLETSNSNIFISTINTGPVTSKFRENSLINFKKHIDIKNSFWRSSYEKELQARLESSDNKGVFTLPPSSVANVVLKILNVDNPKPRYYVTKATYILGFAKRVLSQKWLDKLLERV
ncbi:short-chain dehydrogenase [Aliarcobacter trophiarum LMG 25534]|uniref:Short-chain dehydrogenase n=1 Tax=Aliarcobacter trophiarum LMG 25534 TaxID=1032241 RepID=A0AAD0QJP8_9BACT|nr:SDR family NAD(P)-dependent oxidoreductase [Aliarcobacter trophiarum]AXK49132.1 short-chain dehydrogenase/reductase [Aliarcobacter trophiarum LMG 25534]RXI26441.1 short-chain dehydrogenase [Aliarcobacter trophiarum]RXJ89334.1 short-chain dehydrogenase [Aliarcobacter trophiarum LMG 25534]